MYFNFLKIKSIRALAEAKSQTKGFFSSLDEGHMSIPTTLVLMEEK